MSTADPARSELDRRILAWMAEQKAAAAEGRQHRFRRARGAEGGDGRVEGTQRAEQQVGAPEDVRAEHVRALEFDRAASRRSRGAR